MSICFKKIKNFKFFYFLVLIIIFLLFFIFFWKDQLETNYLDYAEGSYLYETYLLMINKKPYQDFFIPQPPVLFYIGYLLLKIYNHIISIKIYLFFIFKISSIFTYLVYDKVFKNKLIALLSLIFTFLLTITIFRWPTFTTETTLRFLISLFVFVYIFISEKNFLKKYFFLNLILILMFLTKYTSIFFILFFYIFFILTQDIEKNKKQLYLIISFLMFFIILILLDIFFGKKFFYQTIFIRKILPLKQKDLLLSSTFYYLIKFLPFYCLNLYLGLKKMLEKKYQQSFIFLISVFWFPNLIFNFFEGTYLYIFYPIENFLLIGFFYLIFQKKFLKNKNIVKLILYPLFLWSLLVLVYQFQIFIDNYYLISNKHDLLTTQKLIEEIKMRQEKELIAPPFFLFMAKKKTYDNFHDPFFVFYYLIKKDKKNTFEKTFQKLKKIRPKIIISDWRIKSVLLMIDKNYFDKYKKIKEFFFLNNQSETITLYQRLD
ncbi:MAG: glycosyltransferase family 39 protein [Patescibacteria group bacterium]|nr:glycosyltransferase family 39 protein [Patescibacteria group bacterium]